MIYVVSHKQVPFPAREGYRVIQAGAASGHQQADVYDDDGDNISVRNANYCELTAIYWLWQHCKDDVIGIVHYRRLFSNRWNDREILSYQDARKVLQRYDIIMPQVAHLELPVGERYTRMCGKARDLDLVRNIMMEQCPEYVSDYDSYLLGRRTCFLNMMICRKELYDAYCEWLFSILFALDEQIDLTEYDDYQRRVFGFLAELLLNVWVRHQGLRVCHIFIVETERELSAGLRLIYRLARTVTYRLQTI